jgi:hypothetical protein
MTEVEDVLKMLGIEYEAQGGEFKGKCPMHLKRAGKQDNNPSWYINAESGMSWCHSCHYRANLERLIADVRGIDIGQAKSMVVEARSHIDPSVLRRRLAKAMEWKPRRSGNYFPESGLASFDDPPQWALEKRRLTLDACLDYGVRWEDGRWILPIRDPANLRLWGWQIKGEIKRTFVRNRPTGVEKARTLFGIDTTQEAHQIWVVESPLDAVRLHSVGISALATYGSSVSATQMSMLATFDTVICAFDNPLIDTAGKHATDVVVATFLRWGVNCLTVTYPGDCKDPGDCTDEQILRMKLSHAVRW